MANNKRQMFFGGDGGAPAFIDTTTDALLHAQELEHSIFEEIERHESALKDLRGRLAEAYGAIGDFEAEQRLGWNREQSKRIAGSAFHRSLYLDAVFPGKPLKHGGGTRKGEQMVLRWRHRTKDARHPSEVRFSSSRQCFSASDLAKRVSSREQGEFVRSIEPVAATLRVLRRAVGVMSKRASGVKKSLQADLRKVGAEAVHLSERLDQRIEELDDVEEVVRSKRLAKRQVG